MGLNDIQSVTRKSVYFVYTARHIFLFIQENAFLLKKKSFVLCQNIAIKFNNGFAGEYLLFPYLLHSQGELMTYQNKSMGSWFIPPSHPMNHQDSFSIESSAVTGSIVPIAFMNGQVRIMQWSSQFNSFPSQSPQSLLARGSLLFIYFFYEPYSINYRRINIDALLHCLLRYEVIERPYMLEAYIFDILFLSFFPPLRLHISFYFLFPLHIKGFLKKISVATTI